MTNYAMLVGVGNYFDSQIRDLKHSNNAIKKLSKILVNTEGFEQPNLRVFLKEDFPQDPLKLPIKYSIISFLLNHQQTWKVQKDDFLLFYFIGHGYGSVHGDQILTMDTCFQYLEETALSVSALISLIRRIRAQRKLIVFDCCRNEVEGMLGDQEGLGKKKITEEEFITLYACQPRERAWIPLEGDLPLLTDAFIKATENEDCRSIRDLEQLVIERVTDKSYEIGARQTPEMIAKGQDLSELGFLSRIPRKKALAPSEDFLEVIKESRERLHYLYVEKYPNYAPSWGVFNDAAKKLTDWETKIDHRTFRRIAFELLETGENADVYAVSFMLKRGPDLVLFEPLIEALSTKKYRGTAVWQALSALETMVREESMQSRLTVDPKVKTDLISLLKNLADTHPTREGYAKPFASTVVWGKILQICRRIVVSEDEVFSQDALQRLQDDS